MIENSFYGHSTIGFQATYASGDLDIAMSSCRIGLKFLLPSKSGRNPSWFTRKSLNEFDGFIDKGANP